MNPLGNLLIIIICAVAGLIFGSLSKLNKGITGKELWGKIVGALIPGAIFGAILGILLSIFSIINLGLNGLVATLVMMLTGAIVGSIVSALATIASSSWLAGLFAGLGLGLLINALVLTSGSIIPGSTYWRAGIEPIISGSSNIFSDLAKYKYCLTLTPPCPFLIDWSDANVQTRQEALEVNVNFQENQIKQDKINILAEISVQNPEKYELHLTPRCFLGTKFDGSREIDIKNQGSYFQGYEFVFPMSSDTMSTSLRCSDDVPECQGQTVCQNQKIFLVLERPVILQGVWPIYVGQKYSVAGSKKVKTELKFNAPWQISLYSTNDMPYDQGKTYDFQIAIRQVDETTEIKNIELIRLTFPENIIADCDNFQPVSTELELRNINETWLKANAQYDSIDKKYTIACSMYIKNAPVYAELSPIEIESDYVVYSVFSKTIVKQP
jgi:hypothetical protein